MQHHTAGCGKMPHTCGGVCQKRHTLCYTTPRMDELTRQIRADREQGLSIAAIAKKHNSSMSKVREVLEDPKYLSALTRHRRSLAVHSYTNAVRATQIISKVLDKYEQAGMDLGPKDLRDLAWVAKAQFDQAGALLKGVLKDHELDADRELADAAKLIAAKLLREGRLQMPPDDIPGEAVEVVDQEETSTLCPTSA